MATLSRIKSVFMLATKFRFKVEFETIYIGYVCTLSGRILNCSLSEAHHATWVARQVEKNYLWGHYNCFSQCLVEKMKIKNSMKVFHFLTLKIKIEKITLNIHHINMTQILKPPINNCLLWINNHNYTYLTIHLVQ